MHSAQGEMVYGERRMAGAQATVGINKCYAKLSHDYDVNSNLLVDFDLAMSKIDITMEETQLSM